jgi:hypothetical protein
MKRMLRTVGFAIAFAIIAFLGLASYVRLAPTAYSDWHQIPESVEISGAWQEVTPLTGGATLRLNAGDPAELLASLATIAAATPRTVLVSGTPAEGRMTWETRSLIWGFPDYATAEVRPDGLYIYARLRFGRSDMGVNAARLNDWLSQL